MKTCILISVVIACATAQFANFRPSQPYSFICSTERSIRQAKRDVWTPSCKNWLFWNIQQQDALGRAWCVYSRSGRPYMWNTFFPRDAIDCMNSQVTCRSNLVYSSCVWCKRTCESINNPNSCQGGCKPGCTCPSGTYWHWGSCVPRSECSSMPPQLRRTTTPPTISSTTSPSPVRTTASSNGSSPVCPENQQYYECKPCSRTCATRHLLPVCNLSCRRGCGCPDDLYLAGERCVRAADCPSIFLIPSIPETTFSSRIIGSSFIEPSRIRVKNNGPSASRDSVTLTPCQIRRANSNGGNDVKCDEHGNFNTTQCSGDECRCVNKISGETLSGTERPKQNFNLKCAYLGDCPLHMDYHSCSTYCPPTCDNPQPRCTRQCTVDCSCREGYVRISKTNVSCVRLIDCPPDPSSCSYQKSNIDSMGYLQCEETGGYKPKQCNGETCWCVNADGKLLARTVTNNILSEGTCLAARDCRFDQQMEFSLCAPCQRTCNLKNCTSDVCTAKCHCREGFVYDELTNTCVAPDKCPPPPPSCNATIGEEWNNCPTECDATCEQPFKLCSLLSPGSSCAPRCACKAGNVRNQNNVCVTMSECSDDSMQRSESSGARSSKTCNMKRKESLLSELFDNYVPVCDDDGNYQSRQCYGFLLECWCVDKITGEELLGSRGAQFNPDYNVDCDNYAVPPLPPVILQ